MVAIHLWENHVDKVVLKLLDILDTKQYGNNLFLKVDYSLRVIISEAEKIILLCMIFGIAGYLPDFMIAFGTIILLRTCTGGIHRQTLLGCFLQSLLTFFVIVFLGKNRILESYMYVFIVIALVALILCFAPIQSKNRIHYSENQRLKFKVKALTLMIVVLLLRDYIPMEQYNIMMFAILAHTFELVLLSVQIQRKGGGPG